MTKIEKLQKIIELCYKISTKTVADVFFNYTGEVNSVSVYYFPNGFGLCYSVYLARELYLSRDDANFRLSRVITDLEVVYRDAKNALKSANNKASKD